jgi:hypothetical protein
VKQYRFIRFLGEEVESVGESIEDLAEELVSEHEEGQIPSEREANQALSDRINRELLRRIKEQLDGKHKGGIEFSSRVLSNQKKDSEESRVGADLAIVFEADLPDYTVSKAVLVQCKTLRSRSNPGHYNTKGLADEARRMLTHSSDSFVFVFPVQGSIQVIPAFAINAIAEANESIPTTFPEDVYGRRIGRFFEELAQCFVGDHTIVPNANEPLSWEREAPPWQAWMDEAAIRHVLCIGVRPRERDAQLSEF